MENERNHFGVGFGVVGLSCGYNYTLNISIQHAKQQPQQQKAKHFLVKQQKRALTHTRVCACNYREMEARERGECKNKKLNTKCSTKTKYVTWGQMHISSRTEFAFISRRSDLVFFVTATTA